MDSSVTGSEMHRGRLPLRLAATLAPRECTKSPPLSGFSDLHPSGTSIISTVKLIAEPWDAGRRRIPGSATSPLSGRNGMANTPVTNVRDDWQGGTEQTLGELAQSAHGSSLDFEGSIVAAARRRASISSTAHDGFNDSATLSPTTTSTMKPTAKTMHDGRQTTIARRNSDTKGPTSITDDVNALPPHASIRNFLVDPAALAGRADDRRGDELAARKGQNTRRPPGSELT